MDVIEEIVKNVAVIIILISFLELFLPDGNMRKYVQLILGLFIIVIILNPVMSLVEDGSDFSIEAWSSSVESRNLESILADGEELAESGRGEAVKDYGERLEKQIASLIKIFPEVSEVYAEVNLEKNNAEAVPAKIDMVIVKVSKKGIEEPETHESEIENIDPVDVRTGQHENKEVDAGSEMKAEDIENRIKSTISSFYGLRSEQVEVEIIDK